MTKKIFRPELPPIHTIVVKTGSRILTADGHEARVQRLVNELAALHKAGIHVVLVSSGAIAHGMKALGYSKRPATIPLQQACASIGQNRLMHMYQTLFTRQNMIIGQVLLTWDDLRNKKRYLNLRNTFFQLLECGAIPIVNENDSVGVEEIQFGNNDVLGAQIALLVQADVFVNLTDVGGLYDKNPHTDTTAKHIPVVKQVSSSLHKLVSEKKTEISVGGMSSKLKAVEIVNRAGIIALIGDGYDQGLLEVLKNERAATLFLPSTKKMSLRSSWIAFSGQSTGAVIIDDGAQKALVERGKSLLPAGVRSCTGSFKAGDMIDVKDRNGKLLARGLSNFSSEELQKICGHNSSEITTILGDKKFVEAIHRNNMVVLTS